MKGSIAVDSVENMESEEQGDVVDHKAADAKSITDLREDTNESPP